MKTSKIVKTVKAYALVHKEDHHIKHHFGKSDDDLEHLYIFEDKGEALLAQSHRVYSKKHYSVKEITITYET